MCRARRPFTTAIARKAVSRKPSAKAIPMVRYGKSLVDVGVATVGVDDAGGLTTELYQPSVSGVCWTAAVYHPSVSGVCWSAAEYQPSVSVVDGTTKACGAAALPGSVIGMAEAAGTMNRAVANAMSIGLESFLRRMRFIIGGASLFG